MRVYSRLNIASWQTVNLSGLIVFPNGKASQTTTSITVNPATPGIQLSSLVLTDRVQAASTIETVFEALKIGKYQLILSAQNTFDPRDPLTIYLGIQSAVDIMPANVTLLIRSDKKIIESIPAGAVRRGEHAPYYALKQFRLANSTKGKYTIQAAIELDGATIATSEELEFSAQTGADRQ